MKGGALVPAKKKKLFTFPRFLSLRESVKEESERSLSLPALTFPSPVTIMGMEQWSAYLQPDKGERGQISIHRGRCQVA